MNKSTSIAVSAEFSLIATIIVFLAFRGNWIAVAAVIAAAIAVACVTRLAGTASQVEHDGLAVGVGTVRTVEQTEAASGERQIWIEVSGVHGDTFIGRLINHDGAVDASALRPGLVVLVAFDPAAREELSLPDDALAVRASGLVLA